MRILVKITTSICGIICLFATSQYHAQWDNLNASINSSDLIKFSGEPYKNYKGLAQGTFEIQAFVETRKDKDRLYLVLHTKSIILNEKFSYNYRGGTLTKFCVPGPNGGLMERKDSKTEFFAGDLGQEPFT